MGEKEEAKEPRITVKGLGEITEQDYRGIIAVTFSVGTVVAAVTSVIQGRLDAFTSVMAVLGPIVSLIVKDYFNSKE